MDTVKNQTPRYAEKYITIPSIYEIVPELEDLEDNQEFDNEHDRRSFFGGMLKKIAGTLLNGNGLNGNSNGHKGDQIAYREVNWLNKHIRKQANYAPDEELIVISKKDFEKALTKSKKEGFNVAKNATLVALKSGFVTSLVEDQAYKQGMPALASYLQRLFFPIRTHLEPLLFKAATRFWDKFEKRNWDFIDSWLNKEQNRVPCADGLCPDEASTEILYNGTAVKEADKKILYEDKGDSGTSPAPEDVSRAFESVLLSLESGYDGTPRRKPVRLLRVQGAFQGKETTLVPIEELERQFKEDGVKYPRKTAASAISWLNANFEDLGIDLEIETVRFTGYRFRKRSL